VATVWPTIEPRLVDLAGAARFLAVSQWTVRDLLAAGELRRVKLPCGGRRVLLDLDDLRRLISACKEAP
jgi:excisionase family DNA binding protein